MQAALAAARLVHYAASAGLFGLALFPIYGRPLSGLKIWLTGLTLAALISALAWLALVIANLAGTIDPSAVATVVTEMGFGRVWAARLVLGAGLLLLLLVRRDRAKGSLVALSGLFLTSIALTGHTQTHEGGARALHVAADAIHLAAAGAWLGGLIGLSLMLAPGLSEPDAAAVGRFSRMAYVAVAGLVISGAVNALMLVGRLEGLVASTYGRLLIVKLGLFAAMLGLAAINRFQISPKLTGPQAPTQGDRLRRHVVAEQALGIAVLGCVAWLGLSQPPA